VARRLFDLGCDEVSIADTIGSATPDETDRLLQVVVADLPLDRIAFHFHDTRGQAIQNIERAHAAGVRIFDSAAGGLGGCPFAPGAAGNVATEKVVEFFESRDIATGVDRDALIRAASLVRVGRA
jgi:isopropylmalate/homocitrate/citramalate synthase